MGARAEVPVDTKLCNVANQGLVARARCHADKRMRPMSIWLSWNVAAQKSTSLRPRHHRTAIRQQACSSIGPLERRRRSGCRGSAEHGQMIRHGFAVRRPRFSACDIASEVRMPVEHAGAAQATQNGDHHQITEGEFAAVER